MKKLFVASVLAMAVTVASQQQASAWSEFKFSAGVNFGWRGGGNRVLWGLYQSSPYPGDCGGGDCGYPSFGGWGGGVSNYYGGYSGGWQAPAPTPAQNNPVAPAPAQQGYANYYNTGYQPVGYYYYPGYYPQYQAPAYWYGR